MKTPRTGRWLIVALCAASSAAFGQDRLPGTVALEMEGDIAAQMVDGINAFLGKKTREMAGERDRFWNRDFSSRGAYERSVSAPSNRTGGGSRKSSGQSMKGCLLPPSNLKQRRPHRRKSRAGTATRSSLSAGLFSTV